MGIRVEYFRRVRGWLDEGRAEITHTLERIIQETGTTDKSVLARDPSWWRQLAAGAPAYEAAVKQGVAVTPRTDEHNRIVAATYRASGRTTEESRSWAEIADPDQLG
jgi:hypothetical protein